MRVKGPWDEGTSQAKQLDQCQQLLIARPYRQRKTVPISVSHHKLELWQTTAESNPNWYSDLYYNDQFTCFFKICLIPGALSLFL